uniref:Uncharacterized protein n=1 Tax=Manihot esculenta TaxID=3983 RepID=A0A199UCC2_MANES
MKSWSTSKIAMDKSERYNLLIKYEGREERMNNLIVDKYSYIRLLTDIYELLYLKSDFIEIKAEIPKRNRKGKNVCYIEIEQEVDAVKTVPVRNYERESGSCSDAGSVRGSEGVFHEVNIEGPNIRNSEDEENVEGGENIEEGGENVESEENIEVEEENIQGEEKNIEGWENVESEKNKEGEEENVEEAEDNADSVGVDCVGAKSLDVDSVGADSVYVDSEDSNNDELCKDDEMEDEMIGESDSIPFSIFHSGDKDSVDEEAETVDDQSCQRKWKDLLKGLYSNPFSCQEGKEIQFKIGQVFDNV